ncbi:MAG TPA: pyridoxine 5'-phosphate synthase [Stellaceae bacterium]|nr:pyridoxine 5'-phosphate synthase [Stellaceae bacterium]
MRKRLRLGVNIDHVATLRNARGADFPDPVAAAHLAASAGADGITAHLREDRRHIRDDDIARLRHEVALPLNLEMAVTEEMLAIALNIRPHAVCLVPEGRAERTTEGGLDVRGNLKEISRFAGILGAAGVRVSLFIDPDPDQVAAAAAVGAPVIELHTGTYCAAPPPSRGRELGFLAAASSQASRLGLECHAGHGLSFETVGPVAAIAAMTELNIGHFLVAQSVFTGFAAAIWNMRKLMDAARGG